MTAEAEEVRRNLAPASPWSGYQVYVVIVLMFVYTVGFIDRQVLNLLVNSIKADLVLSDVQISFLQGAAFSVAFLLLTPFFGRGVDLFGRRPILAGGLFVWSAMTAACAMARSFWTLLLARAGIGGAEGTISPAVYSILSDTFEDRQLPAAFGIVFMGPFIGGGLALLLGGLIHTWAEGLHSGTSYLAGFAPWQITFALVSLPGLLCLLLFVFVREPVRRGAALRAIPMREVWAFLRANRSFYWKFYAGMTASMVQTFIFPAWFPAFLMRRFHLSVGNVGVHYGTVTLVCGSIGVLLSPVFARLAASRGQPTANLLVPAIYATGITLCAIALAWADSYFMCLALGGLMSFLYSAPAPLAASALQQVTPGRMRGFASSIYVFSSTIVGLAIAPTVVALLTDRVFHDEARVGSSLFIVSAVTGALAALCLTLALPSYRAMLISTHEQ
jgi:MFS family permease